MAIDTQSWHAPFADLSLYRKLRRAGGMLLTVVDQVAQRLWPFGFDRAHGVETTDDELGLALYRRPIHDAHGRGRYEPTTPRHFRFAMSLVPGPLERWSFVDIGSGKGRAVLLAMGYPFRHVEGVELNGALHATAQRNLLRYRGPRRCGEVALRCQDATTAPLPPGDVVVFFYNSFQGELLERFLDHLEAAVRPVDGEPPRRLLLVYSNPMARAQVEQRPAFEQRFAGHSRRGLAWRGPRELVVYGAGARTAAAAS